MRKVFLLSLVSAMMIALLSIIAVNYNYNIKLSEKNTVQDARNTITQLITRIESNEKEQKALYDSLAEDYLIRCHSLQYIIENNPEVIEDNNQLEHLLSVLNVDEIHIIGENGLITHSTNSEYIGFDMNSSPQSAEFVELMNVPDGELVQEMQPNGAENKIFQYIGVARQDCKGVIQIGLRPDRYISAQNRTSLTYIFAHTLTDADKEIYAINCIEKRYTAHSDSSLNGGVIVNGYSTQGDYLKRFSEGGYYEYLDNEYFTVAQEYDGMILGVTYTVESMRSYMNSMYIVTVLYFIAVFVVIIIVISVLLDKLIVKGIHRIIRDMNMITQGDLDKNVSVNTLPEFEQLSSGINSMVDALTENYERMAMIIDSNESIMAAYDCNSRLDTFNILGNLRMLFDISSEEYSAITADRETFLTYIGQVKNHPFEEDSDIYSSGGKWLRIKESYTETGLFGIVTDVTDYIEDKRRITNERDRDALTGLYNRRCFERKVNKLLEKSSEGVSAMLMIDLDNFKSINDSYGHAFGDEYLKFTAECMRRYESSTTIVGRRSGDEFYIFFSSCESRDAVSEVIVSLYAYADLHPITAPDGTEIKVGFSSGAVFANEEHNTYEELLNSADDLLYKVKNGHKGTFMTE
ncbi:MAG: sensor domain-containing diguanylate cyclase [Oscillospiraceae bacterium]|nr:sensor domain-containing diguanylate cyclase [Oscillospiraceae bacterium]